MSNLPPRFSGIPRKKIILILTEKMYYQLVGKKTNNQTVQDLIREVLEGYLSSNDGRGL